MIQECTTTRLDDGFHIYLTLKKQELFCTCGSAFPLRFKEYYTKSIVHNLFMDTKTIIHYRARRYQCLACRKTIYEQNPFCALYQKRSYSLANSVITKLMKPENTFSSVAFELNISVTSVVNIFDQLVDNTRLVLPEVLCIDEIYYSRHASYKYCCVFVDWTTRKLVEIFESRHKYRMIQALDALSEAERNKVKVVCIDMYDTYKQLVKRRFSNAVICIDRFHIIKLFNDKLNEVRLKVMKLFDVKSNEYYVLKKFKFLLFKNKGIDINHPSKFNRKLNGYYNYYRLLDYMLSINKELEKAYQLKRSFQKFLNDTTKEREALESRLFELIKQIKQSNIEEIRPIAATLEKWWEEILNSFLIIEGRQISNGPIESVNRILKKIKNNANGFRNFQRFRARAFLVINKKFSLKQKGNEHLIARKSPKRGPYKKR